MIRNFIPHISHSSPELMIFIRESILSCIGGAKDYKEIIFSLKTFAELCLKVKTQQYWLDFTDLLQNF